MRLCLDACVLYPTVLRELLIGLAGRGVFEPIWSARILEEWARAAEKRGDGPVARGEIAQLRAAWPGAEVEIGETSELWLPDENDIHVLGAARSGGAEKIITFNLRDFPARELSGQGIVAEHPDRFLYGLWLSDLSVVEDVAEAVRAKAEALSGEPQPMRALMKRARLPRLGKALQG